jgi:hypothetical protein
LILQSHFNEGRLLKKDRPQNKNLRPFPKGVSGNPKGKPKGAISPIQRALKELTVDTYREVIELVLVGNEAAVEAILVDDKRSLLQKGVARAFIKACKNGDYEVIERIAERIVGKIPDNINLISKNLNANMDVPPESKVTSDEVKAAFDELEREV